MLDRLEIDRFKSIEHIELELGRVTLLVGPNNAGKSSVLQGLQFGVSVMQSLQLDGTARWSGGSISGTLASEQLVYTPLRDVHALARGGSLRQDKAKAIGVTLNHGDDSSSISVRRGKNKNILVSADGEELGRILENSENPFSVIAPGLAGIPAFEEFKTPGIVRRAAAKGDANNVLRNVLLGLRNSASEWNVFQSRLHRIFPNLSVEVEFDPEADEHIRASSVMNGTRLPIDSSGTGALQAIQILAYIGAYKPRVLILDEPDSHLHPDNQRRLARLLSELAEEQSFQVLISTHSRHLLDEFVPLGAKLHWLTAGGVEDSDFDLVRALLGLGALDAVDRLRNGDVPLVVLTEDAKDDYLRVILSSSGWLDNEYDIWSYAGCTNLTSATILVKFIHDHAPGTKIVVHRDRDYLSDTESEKFENKLTELDAVPFLTPGTDIESGLLNEHHLQEVFPEIQPDDLSAYIKLAIEEAGEKSLEKMINSRCEAEIRRRNRGEHPMSPGETARRCREEYDSNPNRYLHGKTTLKALNRIIQERTGLNRTIARPGNHLSVKQLRDLKP